MAAAGAAAVFKTRKQLPDRRKLLIYLEDSSGASGGLLAAGLETELGPWRDRIRPLPLPEIRGRLKYGLLSWAAGAVFLCGAAWCPVRHFEEAAPGSLQITEEIEELQEKLEILEEESLIPSGEAAELKNALADLRTDGNADKAGRIYELLDKITRRVDSAGMEGALRLENAVAALGTLETAARTLAECPSGERFGELSREFGEILKKLAAADPEMAELLKQAAAAGAGLNNLTPETMNKLAEAMKQMSSSRCDALQRLFDAGLMKKKLASEGASRDRRAVDEAALAKWLEQQALESGGLCNGVCPFPGGNGRGGIGRGRADADLAFTGQTRDDGGERRSVRIDGGGESDRSTLLVSFAAPPGENEEIRAAAPGHLQGGDTVVEQRRSAIRPEHRAAVEQYFKTGNQSK